MEEKRFHGLDALRGIAMLLGIVLHAALPYIPDIDIFSINGVNAAMDF